MLFQLLKVIHACYWMKHSVFSDAFGLHRLLVVNSKLLWFFLLAQLVLALTEIPLLKLSHAYI